jgi:hypothetical protein
LGWDGGSFDGHVVPEPREAYWEVPGPHPTSPFTFGTSLRDASKPEVDRFFAFLRVSMGFGGRTRGTNTFSILSRGILGYFRSYGTFDPLGPLLGLKFGSIWGG